MVCVCVVLKTPSFLLSPILQHVGIANQRQNVLMTVRASSAHGMSSEYPIATLHEETANIWPSMKRTWGCRDVLSRLTYSLWIWCSLATQEVLKSSRSSPTWPPARLCLGCGLRVEEKFTHLSMRTRTFVHSFGEATSICPACL